MKCRRRHRRGRQPTPDRPTVFTLDPALFAGATELALRNWAHRTGVVRRINYGALPIASLAALGVAMLDKQLRETPGRKYVLGWSEGAQIIYKWLRERGPTSGVDPSEVVFISIGNPERKYGGACVVPSPPPKLFGLIDKPRASYGGCGLPDDTPFRVVDFVREGDGWADCPTVECPSELALGIPDDGIHMDYGLFDPSVTLDNPSILTRTEGNVTYALLPTPAIRNCDREATACDFNRPPYERKGIDLL